MWTILSIGYVTWQYILLVTYNILHIGTMLLKYICVGIGCGYRISWFWHKYERQTYFRVNLCAYWVVIFVCKVLYGRVPGE